VLDYSLLLVVFSFAGGCSVCPGAALDYFPGREWVGRGVVCGVKCSPVHSTVSRKHLWSWLAGRNGLTFFSMAWHKEAFHRIGVQDVTEFDSY
jgi:hypothetical protein